MLRHEFDEEKWLLSWLPLFVRKKRPKDVFNEHVREANKLWESPKLWIDRYLYRFDMKTTPEELPDMLRRICHDVRSAFFWSWQRETLPNRTQKPQQTQLTNDYPRQIWCNC
ncbi:MAG: hypothetical protein AMJ46_12810 [Latescibacteria bacterium DG_63]|nr:MAG: hypothetical protein AMJ46_12810 [Latescibacteria bacterium DG_63]